MNLAKASLGGGDDLNAQWDEATAKLQELQDTYTGQMRPHGRVSFAQDEATNGETSESTVDLSEAAVSVLEPLFKRKMLAWDQPSPPTKLVSSLDSLRQILDIDHELTRRRPCTYYETMLLNDWFAAVRDFLRTEWNVHDPENAIALLESWQVVLPDWLRDKVMKEAVVPRIVAAVKVWRPGKSSGSAAQHGGHHPRHQPPMYTWIFPWLPFLSEEDQDPRQPEGLFGQVKRKVDLSEWPHWKPLIGEKRRPQPAVVVAAAAASAAPPVTPRRDVADEAMPEMSFREFVEAWCDDQELLLTNLHQPTPSGQPLYRIHSAGSKGVVVYFQGDVVWHAKSGEPVELDAVAAMAQ